MSDGAATLVPGAALVSAREFYFSGDDHLLITSWNSLASVGLTVVGRFLQPDGTVSPLSRTHTPNTNRTAATDVIRCAQGWLQNLSIIVTGATPQRGQTFVRVDVIRGDGSNAIVVGTLLQGYVTATKRLAWPGAPIEDSLAGQGALRSVLGTDPAANVEIVETVPTGARWKVRLFTFVLVTDGTAGNRETTLVVDDGTNILGTFPAGFTHIASLTKRYTAAPLGAATAPTQATDRQIVIPDLVLPAAARLSTVTTAIQATDNYGAPRYEVEEWLEAI